MNIAAEDSLGVFAECPQCHRSIQHGFQVCGHCGHRVTADQQQVLRENLGKHFLRYALVAGGIITLVVAAANQWFV